VTEGWTPDHLRSIEGPFVHVAAEALVPALTEATASIDFPLYILSVGSIADKKQLFEAASEALQFPAYYGRNWNALEEFLTDFFWLPPAPGNVLVVSGVKEFLDCDPSDFEMFVLVAIRAAENAAESLSRPLHLVFIGSRALAEDVDGFLSTDERIGRDRRPQPHPPACWHRA
jgi:RNAse (barnase) inhibitor barstar